VIWGQRVPDAEIHHVLDQLKPAGA
jgi:hypothetical protein